MEPDNARSIANRKINMGEQSLHYVQRSILGHSRCCLSRLHMLDRYTNLNFDSGSTKATVLAYGQTGSGKTYTMVWLPTNAEVV